MALSFQEYRLSPDISYVAQAQALRIGSNVAEAVGLLFLCEATVSGAYKSVTPRSCAHRWRLLQQAVKSRRNKCSSRRRY